MNGKKAKHLRSLSSITKKSQQDRSYFIQQSTIRNIVVKDLLGNVTHRVRTATCKLNAGPRLLYKALKRNLNKI